MSERLGVARESRTQPVTGPRHDDPDGRCEDFGRRSRRHYQRRGESDRLSDWDDIIDSSLGGLIVAMIGALNVSFRWSMVSVPRGG
jgi:hypothetical protein